MYVASFSSQTQVITTMDLDIVRLILQNSGTNVSKVQSGNCETETENDQFESRNPELTSALAKSLATLLCHKVSPAAHQRYLVRTNLIEQLRDWSRITSRYSHLQCFTDGERTTKFAMNLVNKYLTEEFIAKQPSVNVLVKLGFALIDMKLRNSTFEYKLDNIINRILSLDRTNESDIFLDSLIDNYQNLSLGLASIENIYYCRAEKLIEIPITDLYILFNANHRDGSVNVKNMINHIETSENDRPHSISQLLKYSSKSARIFQLLSSVMKEILSYTNCCETFVNFIQFVINHIRKLCEEEKNQILDLYPRNLKCAVILLRIEPNLHTQNSKNYTLQKLRSIYSLNKQELLILLTHFPLWLEEFSSFISGSNDLLLR